MRGRLLLALVAGAAVVAAVWWRWSEPPALRLPERLVVEDEITTFVPEGAQVGPIKPGDPLRGAGPRRALLAPPGTRLVWRVPVPSDAVLYLNLAVEGPGKRDLDLGGIRFVVRVDGREAFTRVVNPAATRSDRRWFAARVELPAATGDAPRELEFLTEAVDAERRPAGTPGWNQVRLVRETSRDRQQASPDAPSVIVVLVDTLRADRLGCYGAPKSPSPALDALAATGVVFEHAVAQSSWTMPSVASLMTGLHPRSHGAWGSRTNRDEDDATGQLLAHAAVTWAEVAAHAGITTIGVSANPLVSRETNLAQGFETFVDLPWDAEGRNWAPASAVNAAFLRWLAANRGVRFAAHLQYMEPHDPYTPANAPPAGAGVRAPIAAGWVRDLANQVNWRTAPPLPAAEIAHLRALYDGEIRAWDRELARLLAGLDALGVRDSTLVVVTADHGEEFQEHGRLTHGSHLYEETLHVPLVVAGPGIRPARREDLAQGIDLFPTLAARLGVPPPSGLPGRDLLAGGAPGPVFSETVRGIAPDGSRVELLAARRGSWKLVRTPALDRTELYDLAKDPDEQQNRWGDAPEGAELAALLAAFQASAAPAPAPEGGAPGLREKLRALGYAQ